MVKSSMQLDLVYGCLADPTRRDIIERLTGYELTVSQLASYYDVSLAAISRHLKLLYGAGLIRKHRQGKYFIITTNPSGLVVADEHLERYRAFQSGRYDRLEVLLQEKE